MAVETVSTEARPRVWIDALITIETKALSGSNRETNSCFCLRLVVINGLKNVSFPGPDKRFLFKRLLLKV